jgi:hypothetical protein
MGGEKRPTTQVFFYRHPQFLEIELSARTVI